MMRTAFARAFGLVLGCSLALAAAACGNDGGNNPGTDGGSNNPTDGSTADTFVPEPGYTKLIGRTWTLPAGATDTYRCVRLTLTEDTYVTNIVAQAPTGTHHTVLSIAGANGTSGADGEYNCSVATLGMVMLYASGVGTSPLDFPSGVGLKIPAGTQIHLNLHLFNVTDGSLSGESGIWVKKTSTPPPTLAEMVFAGTSNIVLPSSASEQTATGGCTVPANAGYTLFAVWPHMHQIATHQKVELIRSGTPTILHDRAFAFGEQNYYLQSPEVQVQPGDEIRVTCSYLNNTGHLVTFGDSSTQEMCFSGLYRYPARNAGLFECSTGPGL